MEPAAGPAPAREPRLGLRPADIAIVGMSAIMPGASDLRRYWENILDKVGAIAEVPADRWPAERYYDADPSGADKVRSKWGGFLPETPFDPTRFGIPPTSVPSIDPAQLFALLAAEAALADAGLSDLAPELRRRAAVILAFTGGLGELGLQYAARAEMARALPSTPPETLDFLPEWTSDSFAGLLPNVVAGRIANRFDLGGATFTVDAACASSLAALRQATVELESGRSDLVLCGAIEVGQGPFAFTCFSKAQALSPAGTCRAFDAEADGTAISEGIAMLVLRRLEDAQAAGDRIYAVIKGIDGSSDGRARGMMAPLPDGQKLALRRAYEQAGYSPASVEMFEAHGTGTVAGDAAEIESLSDVLRGHGAAPATAAVGSVKTLIGHAEGAAGMAGLIKVALGLSHRVMPPHAGVETPNAALRRPDCPIALYQLPRPWLARPATPRRAGVSGFGFGGANYHVTLEEHGGKAGARAARDRWPLEIFVWRMADRTALADAVSSGVEQLRSGATPELGSLARALASRLDAGTATLAIVAGSHDALAAAMSQAIDHLRGTTRRPLPHGVYLSDAPLASDGRLAMLFPGQGSQYPDMGRELAVAFGEVAEVLGAADAILAGTPTYQDRADPRLSRLIYPFERFGEAEEAAAAKALAETDKAQPALGAVETAMLALTSRLGLIPAMAAGHSYGEYVALHAAGVLDFRDLLRVSEARGRSIIEAARGADLGTMTAVAADAAKVRAAIGGTPDVVIANINGPAQTVISGPRAAIAAASAALGAHGLSATPIPVSAAFHSPLMQPAQAPLSAVFDELAWGAPRLPVYSNTTARRHEDDPGTIRSLLARHLSEPVDFVGLIEAMYADGARVFLEVGPKSVLASLTRRILGKRPHCAVSLDSGGGGLAGLLHSLAALTVQGVEVNLARLFEGRQLAPIDPTRWASVETDDPKRRVPGWVLTGARARKADAPTPAAAVAAASQSKGATEHAAARRTPRRETEMNRYYGPVHLDEEPVEPQAGGIDQAMVEHQRTMQQFLQTQERLMLAYLNGGQRATRPFSTPRPVPAARSIAPHPVRAPRPADQATSPAARPPDPQPPGPVSSAPMAPAPGPTVADPQALLLSIASEKTGYPADMLGLDLNMEADLGIDSIKRVEILAAFRKAQPDAVSAHLQPRMTQISKAMTLREILDRVAVVTSEMEGAGRPFERAGEGPRLAALSRYVMRPVPEALPPGAARSVPTGVYVIAPDRTGIAVELARLMQRDGAVVRLVPEGATADDAALSAWLDEVRKLGRIRGVIGVGAVLCPPPRDLAAWRAGMETSVKSLFALLRLVPELAEGGLVAVASAMGGFFGRDTRVEIFAGAGGGVGLVKSLAMEWPECRCAAIDLDPAESPAEQAFHLLAEIAGGHSREVGYPGGARSIFRSEPAPLPLGAPPLVAPGADWVVLAVGGARGITAETLRPFAAAGMNCVIVGRSALPGPEAPELRALRDAGALRSHFLTKAAENGERPTPAMIQARIATALRDRETRANMADFASLGGRVDYRTCDVTDAASVAALLDAVYTRYGRLDALLFGAGLIEDRLIGDKTRDSLARVFDTKVDGAFHFASRLRTESLKFVVLFTSVAGRYGNRGQTDYAAANEVLNRYAWQLQARFGPDIKVTAVNWGPWARTTNGPGMLTPETSRQFRERGLSLIDPQEGRDVLWNELLYAPRDEVEVVAWDLPPGALADDGGLGPVAAAPADRKVA